MVFYVLLQSLIRTQPLPGDVLTNLVGRTDLCFFFLKIYYV